MTRPVVLMISINLLVITSECFNFTEAKLPKLRLSFQEFVLIMILPLKERMTVVPSNLQQDPLNGPLNLSIQ